MVRLASNAAIVARLALGWLVGQGVSPGSLSFRISEGQQPVPSRISGVLLRPALAKARLDLAHHIGGRDFERHGKAQDRTEGRAVDASLKQADVRAMVAAFEAKPLLREAFAVPDLAENPAEDLLWT